MANMPIVPVELVPIEKLNPAPYNTRKISDSALDGLGNALQEFGLVQSVVWNKRTGNLVGGHQRLRAIKEKFPDWSEIHAHVVDLPLNKEKQLNIALNNQHIAGEFMSDLHSLLVEIQNEDMDIFRDLQFDKLFDSGGFAEEDDSENDDSDIPELPKNPVTKPGDVWSMGQHRLICGDCRDEKTISQLFAGEKCNVAFTSPPYASQRKYDESSGFRPIPPDEYVEWFESVQGNVKSVLSDDGSWFVNIKEHAEDGQRHLYVKDLTIAHVRLWEWMFVDEFSWNKPSPPGSWPNRFKNGWEPVFHFSKGRVMKFRPANVGYSSENVPKKSSEIGANKSGPLGSYWNVSSEVESGMALPSNVIHVSSVQSGTGHTAAFPVGLPKFFFMAFSDIGDICFDPFMGSGTSIIAGEKTQRQVYGCEISPGYCDVVIERWESESGQKAIRS